MKPRAPWLTRFTSWFFNTSPDWVEPEQGQGSAAERSSGEEAERGPGSEPGQADAPSSGSGPSGNRLE